MSERAKAEANIDTLDDQQVEDLKQRAIEREPVDDREPSQLEQLREKREKKREEESA